MQAPPLHRPLLAAGLLLLSLAGLAVRLYDLQNSLWLDEFSTLWTVEGTLRDVWTRVPQVMGQSPFYFMVAWGSVHAFGESEWALRLPSLLATCGTSALVGYAAFLIGGRRAAVWAATLFWLCYPAVWSSVDARPYAIGLCFAALATAGWVGLSRDAGWNSRLAWIVGSAGVVWSHYLFVPFILGLGAALFVLPALRAAVPVRRAALDAIAVAVLVFPAGLQFLELLSSRADHDWIFAANHVRIVAPIAPFALAMLMPAGRPQASRDRAQSIGLLVAVLAQLAALEGGALLGANVLAGRYAYVAVVGAAVVAGVNMSRLRGPDIVAPLAVYAVATALAFAGTHRIAGSWTGAGYQQWRQAVAELRAQLEAHPGARILLRSGNAEDDLWPPGQFGWPATLAPLRQPGRARPTWNVTLLTYSWARPGRAAYFEEALAPQLGSEPVFFLLCLYSDEPGSGGYCEPTLRWILDTVPGVQATSLGPFRQVGLWRLDRHR